MDKRQRTIDVVKALHNYQDKVIETSEMIKVVCNYYDFIKEHKLFEGDLQFLKKIANIVGIPHYFDHLNNFQKENVFLNTFSLSTFAAQIYESTLHTGEDSKVHQYQKDILSLFLTGKQNRYFLSASTSFGKTHLVYEIMKKMKYKNIVLIFPTIALLSENLERLHSDELYKSYNIHTLSDVTQEEIGSSNIFIYTPERFLSFLEKLNAQPEFDFVFIDEVYKIDNEYIIDEEEKQENERDVSYRIAAYYSVLGSADILLAGPYIERYSSSFERFLNDNKITKCDFNQYEIVSKSYHHIKTAKTVDIGGGTVFKFNEDETGKQDRLKIVVKTLYERNKDEGCIVYCSRPYYAEEYAKNLPSLIDYQSTPKNYQFFVEHVLREYGEDWVVTKSLKKGIGVHHGLIPKYIQKEIISFFNEGLVKALTSTTTITEGVNTSAKNLIITNNKKGVKSLKRFDAKNIAGRAGRFDKHYSGRIIVLQNKFLDDINAEKESIHHKNYDLNSQKNEIDLFYSSNEFLTDEDKLKRDKIVTEQEKRDIPDNVLNMFKIVSKADKIRVYDHIALLKKNQHNHIKVLIQRINTPSKVGIDWDGFQVILDCILLIVSPPLDGLIKQKTNKGKGKHSVLVPILHNYLEKGFKGLVNYKRENQGEKIDLATRNTAKFVYNTAKY
ncbi:DEAD/DEAH box helicase [Agarilytica rhodophyticola]|uniref:DEAD/DEAH box helicase n=1 Tax=Agarilytica rhodophyticola TaxID=1737490 RepID=UPI000B348EE2|nr:DEAD/DEAH box helicase [Agarilytica rhodophyticola]